MDARGPCPDAALLAAFLDGGLGDDERTAVVLHLADCAQCRAIAVTVIEFREVQALDAWWHAGEATATDERAETREALWRRAKTRAPACAAAAAIACALLAVASRVVPSAPPASPTALLVDAAAGYRLTDARVSGGFAFAPHRSHDTPSARVHEPRLVAAAGYVRAHVAADFGAPARRNAGVAALLIGDVHEAIASLSIAVLSAPDDATAANDLAAAYYERAIRAARADDLPAALDAVERALRLQPALLEAWFNRALVITALGLRDEARDAWRDYQRRDPGSPWAEEARRREEALAVSAEDWQQIASAFAQRPSDETARSAVAAYPHKARELFEAALEAWTRAAASGGDVPALRDQLRALGQASSAVQRERYYEDTAHSIDRAVASGRHRALAAAHQAFFAVRARLAVGDSKLAGPALRAAAESLQAFDSPLALRARVEVATAAYFDGRHDEALRILPPLKRLAADRRHEVVATRAAWIIGLSEFRSRNLAGARVAYEEMLEAGRRRHDAELLTTALVFLANLHEVLGDATAAWTHRLEAMSYVDHLTGQARNNVYLSAAGHALASGHLAAALLFEARLLRPDNTLTPVSEIQSRTQLAATLHGLDRADEARRELDAARRLLAGVKDSGASRPLEADLFAIESDLLLGGNPGAALAAADRGVALVPPGDALRLSRLLLRVSDAALAAGQLDRADAAAARGVRALEALRASSPEGGIASDYDLPLYARAAEVAMRRGDLARAFEYTERRRLRHLFQHRGERASAFTLRDVQQRLSRDTAIAILNQIGDELHLWLITRDDMVVHSADVSASRAAALVSSQIHEIAHQAADPRVSGEIFDVLFRPVRRHLDRIQTIAVVADAPYSALALAGLWDRARGRYLVEDYRLVMAPSATTFARRGDAGAPAAPPSTRMAVVSALAEPHGDRDERAARELATLYDAASVRRESDATPSELLLRMSDRDVVHVAARVGGNGEAGAATLVVADEPGRKYSGSLPTARLATASDVRARLVTLDVEAVDTAFATGFDGAQEVARALLAAGVITVVGRVGALPSAGLDRTWIEFHRHYAAGVAAAESLRRAQIAALSAANRRSGPWATLTVFGSTE